MEPFYWIVAAGNVRFTFFEYQDVILKIEELLQAGEKKVEVSTSI